MIDIRSDTVTVPTQKMRDSILTCPVGDDVFQDDPTSKQLEQLAAEILGKEAALFFPSGTMANQIALMCAIKDRGDEVLLPKDAHMFQNETGAIGALAGGLVRFLEVDSITEEVNVNFLESTIKKTPLEDWLPRTSIVAYENPTSNGQVLPLENMKQIKQICEKLKVHVHVDGARIFNASIYLQQPANEITQYCDSVMVCVSKGLCCPVGSLLAGTTEFIKKARRFRKLLGGTMRQIGVIAAPAIIGLTEMVEPLKTDHEMAKRLAEGLKQFPFLDLAWQVHINMVWFKFHENSAINLQEMMEFFAQKGIRISVPKTSACRMRFMTHHYIREKEVDLVIETLRDFFRLIKLIND